MENPLWIRESEVCELITLDDAIPPVRSAFASQHPNGSSWAMRKALASWGGGHTLHALGGGVGDKFVGTKSWAHTAGGATPLLLLWRAETGRLAAVIEAFALGQLRTASVSSLATDLLALGDASSFAVIGTGKQALPQVAAVLAVRKIETISVWSPNAVHRGAFTERLRSTPVDTVIMAESVREATEGADVVTTVTRSREAFLAATCLRESVHVNAVGAISKDRAEVTPDLVARCRVVVSDSPLEARENSSELDAEVEVVALGEIATRGADAELQGATSLFKAMGSGMADVALGVEVLRRAQEAGFGSPLLHPEKGSPQLFGRSI